MSIWGTLSDRYRVQTEPLRSSRRVELVVAVLTLLLAFQLLYSAARLAFFSGPSPVEPAADVLQVTTLEQVLGVGAGGSAEVRSRPLFWQSRRPSANSLEDEGAQAEGAKAGQIKGVKLRGVFGSGETAGIIALVKGKKQRILLGETLEGWTLESVSPNRVVLVDGTRREELLLKEAVIVANEVVGKKASPGGASHSATGDGRKRHKNASEKPPESAPVVRRHLKRG